MDATYWTRSQRDRLPLASSSGMLSKHAGIGDLHPLAGSTASATDLLDGVHYRHAFLFHLFPQKIKGQIWQGRESTKVLRRVLAKKIKHQAAQRNL